jgi:hypothetical protein
MIIALLPISALSWQRLPGGERLLGCPNGSHCTSFILANPRCQWSNARDSIPGGPGLVHAEADMSRRCTPLFVLAALCLAGCATIEQKSASHFKLPQGEYKLVVMRPDVAVSTLTARGELQRREDWSGTARDHIVRSLRDFVHARGSETRMVRTPEDAGLDEAALLDLERLHGAVGASILEFKFSPSVRLPTKRKLFDWTLGDLATRYGTKSGYDYALFLYARDSFSSAGRGTLQVLSYVGCAVNTFACLVNPSGGRQVAFASLVDLRTGDVVWFNALHSPVGDIRTPEGAQKMMKALLHPLAADAKAGS